MSGEVVDSEQLDILKVPFGCQMQDGRPLGRGLLGGLTEIAD